LIEQLYHSIMKTLFYSIQLKKVTKGILYFLALISTQISAQTYQWAHGFTTPVTNGGVSNKVAIDLTSSDIYNVGKFTTNGTTGTDFDPAAGTNTLVTQANTANGYISKYTSAGAATQAIVFKGGANEIFDIAVDISDNMYVTGYYTGIVDFDPSAAGTFTLPNTATNDIFVAKINANGTFGWAKRIGAGGNDIGRSITLDASNNVFVGGSFNNTVDFDPGVGTTTLSAIGDDGFILKLDNTGNFLNAIKIGDAGGDVVRSVRVDSNNDLFACGYYSSAAAFAGAPYFGAFDGFIGKFSTTTLATTWMKGFGGTEDDTPLEVAEDGLGAIHCTGYFKGTADFDPNAGVTSFTTPAITDIDGFVMKLNASGNLIWARQITGTGSQAPQGISIDNLGDVYIAGFYQGVTDFNPSTAQALHSNNGTSEDIFVLKLNSSGNYIQTQIIGSLSNERCYGIAVEPSTGFYVITGQLNDATTVDFNTSSTTNNVTGDWYLAKYNKCSYPAVPSAISTPTVCSGSVGTLTVTSGTYTTNWYTSVSSTTTYSTGSSATSPTVSAPYTLYAENTNTCGTSARAPLTVYVDNNFLSATLSSTSICQGENIIVTANGAQTYTFASGGTTSGNTYTTAIYNSSGSAVSTPYSGTNANGCVQTSTYTLQVKALPAVSITSFSTSGALCDNTVNTLTATATGASTYTWTPGNVTGAAATFTIPSTSGNYSIYLTGTGSNGCTKTIVNNSINVYSAPTISVNSGAICPGKTFTMMPSGASTYTYSSGSNTVSPSSLTSYSVMGTSALGCVSNSPAIATVSVNPTPIIAVNSGTICSGKSFTIIPSGAQTYTISGGQTVVSPTSNTSYSVTGTSSLGCVGTNTAIASIVVQTNPTVSIAGSNTVCVGNVISLTANGASTYTWNTGAQTNTISPSISSNTNYTVTGAIGTCTSNAIKTVSVVTNPTLTTSSSVNSICSGASVSLNASGASTYLWMPGSLTNSVVSVNPTTTTIYTVTGTAANGCTNTAVRSITVNPTPTVNVNSGAICTGGTFTIIPSGTGVSFYNISGGSYVVSPTSNSSYTITGTSSQGCTNTAVSTVSVQTSLTVSIAGSNSVCAGSPINLTANGAATYTWNTGSTSYTIAPIPTSNTTYTVTGASGTCSSTAVKSITVNPTPTVNAVTSTSTLCTGNTATLTASGANTYNWLPGSSTGSVITINPTTNTTYTVTGTNTFGCSDVSIITQSVSLCTGIENLANNFPSINFYPNPFNDIITIESELPVSKIVLNDILGKAVSTIEKINHEQYMQVNTNELPEGIYFMTVYINNQHKTYKIIKK